MMGLSLEGSKPLPSQNAVASSPKALTILHDHQRGGTLLGTAPRRDAAILSRHLVLPMQDRSQVDQATGKIMDRAAALYGWSAVECSERPLLVLSHSAGCLRTLTSARLASAGCLSSAMNSALARTSLWSINTSSTARTAASRTKFVRERPCALTARSIQLLRQ